MPELNYAEEKSLAKQILDEDNNINNSDKIDRSFYSGDFEAGKIQSIRYGDIKLIRRLKPHTDKDKIDAWNDRDYHKMLYNLKQDIKEMHDLASTEIENLDKMDHIREAYLEQTKELRAGAFGSTTSEPLKVDDRAIERLKTLGYIK